MRSLLLAAVMVAVSIPAVAGSLYNNPGSDTNGVWRFADPSTKQVATDRARFMEEVKGGAYDQWQNTYNYGPTYIDKAQYCNNAAVGTSSSDSATGNSGGNIAVGTTAPNNAPVTANQTCK